MLLLQPLVAEDACSYLRLQMPSLPRGPGVSSKTLDILGLLRKYFGECNRKSSFCFTLAADHYAWAGRSAGASARRRQRCPLSYDRPERSAKAGRRQLGRVRTL